MPPRCRLETEKPRAAAGGALVADLAAGAGGRARERRDGGRVVVRLHLHQHVRGLGHGAVDRGVGVAARRPALDRAAGHHRGVVAVGHHRVLRRDLLGVADHGEHRLRLPLAVDDEVGIEDLVPAVLAVGLREHHQLDVAGVAAQARESLGQVVDLVGRQRQPESGVGLAQRLAAAAEHLHVSQWRRHRHVEQRARGVAFEGHALDHAVVQQRRHGLALLGRQRPRCTEPRALQHQRVLGRALDAVHRRATGVAEGSAQAVARDVGGLAGPGRDGARPRHHQHQRARRAGAPRHADIEQRGQLVAQGRRRRRLGGHPVHVARRDAVDARARRLQARQQCARAEVGEGVAAFETAQVPGLGGHALARWAGSEGRATLTATGGRRRANRHFIGPMG